MSNTIIYPSVIIYTDTGEMVKCDIDIKDFGTNRPIKDYSKFEGDYGMIYVFERVKDRNLFYNDRDIDEM